jgi:uncharacterized protein YggU (UPF0235/DUF167 family)
VEDGTVKVWTTASPTDGQANLAICEILAQKLGLPKSAVFVERGQTSRNKTVIAQGLSQEKALSRLSV